MESEELKVGDRVRFKTREELIRVVQDYRNDAKMEILLDRRQMNTLELAANKLVEITKIKNGRCYVDFLNDGCNMDDYIWLVSFLEKDFMATINQGQPQMQSPTKEALDEI